METRENGKKWKVAVSFVGDSPKDGNRILKEVKTLLEYDRCCGGFGKMPYYWYGIGVSDGNGIYPLTVETRCKAKNKMLNKTEVQRHFRNVHIKVEFLNRTWRTVVTPGGNIIHLCEAA